MADILCGYTADRDETLVAYVYGEIDVATRAAFDAHLQTCERCRTEVDDLQSARLHLRQWGPPEAADRIVGDLRPGLAAEAPGVIARMRQIPRWAQVAAAVLCVGVASAIANVQVRYDRDGLTFKTGWSRAAVAAGSPAPVPAPVTRTDAPWQGDLDRLARDLRQELRPAPAGVPARTESAVDGTQLLKQVRALIDESERRQQRELALRVGEVMRDVSVQRNSDLVKIDRSLGLLQNNTGVEVLRNREMLNYLMSVSQKR